LDDILARLLIEEKPPKGHVNAVKFVVENREAVAAELSGDNK
jgi:hypothetical protein